MNMNTKNRFSIKALISCAVFSIPVILAGCPTTWEDLPPQEEMMKTVLPKILGSDPDKPIWTMEAEDGKLVNDGKDPEVHNSGNASGGKFVKEIGAKQGYVLLTVPAEVPEGDYGLTLVWSGSKTGTVAIYINDRDPIEKEYSHPNPIHGEGEWDMSLPQYMKVTELKDRGIKIKGGDTIRIQNAKLPGDDSEAKTAAWLHLDVMYLYTQAVGN
ncbi:MAG: hypothetical protein LBS97_06415 [Treponema sp.]|jgi:hypothetical protein|nr:hypothetical protein [Treponema sp.]